MNEATATAVRVFPDDEHNRTLVRNAHPQGWRNPSARGRYNLVVVGAGTAGLVAASGAATIGARVALVERHLMGGDCLNVGCVPSKGLIRSARAWAQVRDSAAYGIDMPPGATVNFAVVMERMRRLRARISPHDSVERFASLGVDVFLGDGRFTGRHTVEVGGRTLRFRRAVIATGARAAAPPVPGLEQAGYLTNETIFSLTELPRRLAVIGAGPIGCEMAQAFARFGSEVHLLERTDHVLPREDREAAEIVEKALVHDGVALVTGCDILRVERAPGGRVIHLRGASGETAVEVDQILVGVGRAPNVDGLGLDAAGVSYDPRSGVKVDDHLQTTNPHVFAAGDICFPYKFTHTAEATAAIAIQNALFVGSAKASTLVVPWCTYTDPEVAHVGMYEHEAAARGLAVRTFSSKLSEVDRAILDGEEEGYVKILAETRKGRILGATVVAAHAGDIVSEITVAMNGRVKLGALARTIHPYPTQAEAVRKAARVYYRSRLTPRVKSLAAWWLARRR